VEIKCWIRAADPTLADADMSRPKIWRSAHHWLHAVFRWAAVAERRYARTRSPSPTKWSAWIKAPHAADDTGALLLTLIIASDHHRPVLPPGRRPSPASPTVGTVAQRPSWDGCCVWRKIEIVSIIAIFCNNRIVIVSNYKKWHRNITSFWCIAMCYRSLPYSRASIINLSSPLTTLT